jgi:rubrerythrin
MNTKNTLTIERSLLANVAPDSRRQFLTKMLTGGALAAVGLPLLGQNALAGGTGTATDLDVLNYALTLEHLEYAFYRDGLKHFDRFDFRFVDDNRRHCPDEERRRSSENVYRLLKLIRDHEKTHVDTLISVIQSLGGTPVPELKYDFGYRNNSRKFLRVAQALENTGVMAYDGAIALIANKDLITASATIATVEARHASYLNLINGDIPFPDAFDEPKTMDEIFAIAGQFIVG